MIENTIPLTLDEISKILYNEKIWYHKTRTQIYSVIETIKQHREYSIEELIQEFFIKKCLNGKFYYNAGVVLGLLNYAMTISVNSKPKKDNLTYDKFIVEKFKSANMEQYKVLNEFDKRYICFLKSRTDENELNCSPYLFGMECLIKNKSNNAIHVTKMVKYNRYYILLLLPIVAQKYPEKLDRYDYTVLEFIRDSLAGFSGLPSKYKGVINVVGDKEYDGNYLIKENLVNKVLRDLLMKLIQILEL